MKLGQWGMRRFFDSNKSSSRSLNSLEKRILLIKDHKVSIIPILDKWVKEVGKFDEFEFYELVNRMQQYRGSHHTEVCRWMGDRWHTLLTPGEIAVRLDLIYMVHGLEHAERYFSCIPLVIRKTTSEPYCALLHCYVKEKSLEKAEAHVEQMKKLGLVTTSYFYKLLITLYSQTGQHEKIDILMQEMESNDIPHDQFAMINRLTEYVAISDVGGMEKVLDQMEKGPGISVDWTVYAIMADGYLKAGLIDKALKMMMKVEEMTIKPESNLSLEHLLTLYTRVGKKEELYRIWNLHKSSGGLQCTSYSTMITSLSEFDDMDGAEKIFEEWEFTRKIFEEWNSTDPRVDFRVLNRLVAAYCKKGLLEKAESVVERVVTAKSEKAPYASTWNVLATGYLEEKRMPKAVEMFKKAMLVATRDWKLKPSSVDSCLEYFEDQGDVEEAEEFIKLLRESGPLTQEVYHRLLRTYIAAQKPVSGVLNRMKVDGFCVDETTTNILETQPDVL